MGKQFRTFNSQRVDKQYEIEGVHMHTNYIEIGMVVTLKRRVSASCWIPFSVWNNGTSFDDEIEHLDVISDEGFFDRERGNYELLAGMWTVEEGEKILKSHAWGLREISSIKFRVDLSSQNSLIFKNFSIWHLLPKMLGKKISLPSGYPRGAACVSEPSISCFNNSNLEKESVRWEKREYFNPNRLKVYQTGRMCRADTT